MSLIGVTGVTGRLGSRVARALAAAGLPLRLLGRDPAKLPDLPGAVPCEKAAAPYADRDACTVALKGVGTLLMVSAHEGENRVAEHRAFVEAAAAAGVKHIVYTSFFGAAPDAIFLLARDHYATEEIIKAKIPSWTFLRNNIYADLLAGYADDGVIRGPAGDGKFAPVAIDDCADCLAAVLKDPAAHAGKTYSLTGPDEISMADLAKLLTEITGKPVKYVEETMAEAKASRAKYGAPDWLVDAWISTYTAIAAGEDWPANGTVEELLGRKPISVREAIEAQAAKRKAGGKGAL
ncbi:hypothetical protein DFJ74DRAFT_709992 [Hyaloraphidium curvatum]|nr:hypothetical protein DFJ74DRAFT_709992 [Hyaloraphidium curvatum]